MRYGFLFEQMVRRELRRKYKGSALGMVWYLLHPLALMAAYALMFGLVLRSLHMEHYPLFLLVGIVVWLFLSQSLLAAAPAFVEHASLVRKVFFPRALIPASVVAVQGVIFAVLLALLLPVALALRGTLGPQLLLLIPVLAALSAFVLGLSLAVSVLHAHFRDVLPILSAVLMPWFFVSPIFFRPDDFPGEDAYPWLGPLLQWANPVAPFIEAVRAIVYDGRAPDVAVLAYVAVAGLAALVAGRAVFARLGRELAVVV